VKCLKLENLETRETPAQVILSNGLLSVVAQPTGSVIQVSQQANSVRVLADGQVTLFNSTLVKSMILVGAPTGFNDITNLTSVPSKIVGGNVGNMLQAFGGNDTIICGAGPDTVYDILGANKVVSLIGVAKDTLFVNAASVTLSKVNDQVVSFFGTGRTPGSGSVQLVNGVLYLTPDNNASFTTLDKVGTNIVVTTSYAGSKVFDQSKIKYIGYFGGSNDDVFINNTVVSEVAYGGVGGDDIMIGSFSSFSFMKGGNGNDYLMSRAKKADLSGNGGNDVLQSASPITVFRIDQFDILVGRKKTDLVVM
jgi:hypothetical protein